MTGKHVPGPWTTNSYSRIECSVPYGSAWDQLKAEGEGPSIGRLGGFAIIGWAAQRPDHEGHGDELHSEEARANIALMAAAPELLRDLRYLVQQLETMRDKAVMPLEWREWIGKALELVAPTIAKAEGTQ